MRWGFWRLVALATHTCAMAASAHAQAPAGPPPVPDGPRYVVTYLEVAPTATSQARTLLRHPREASKREPGNLRAEAFQRLGLPYQFVLLEAWQDQAAADNHSKAPTTGQFRDKIKAIQNAPMDERIHFPLSVGTLAAKAGKSAVAAVTHVEVIPLQRENGTAITKQLADTGRNEDGKLTFEAVARNKQQNKLT